jgi:hypothetical protein
MTHSFVRPSAGAVVLAVAALSSACSTVARPTRPSTAVVRHGAELSGLRFDGDETQIREPGMPVSPSRSWQREVANYTASALNEALGVTDAAAPVARTIVTFDLAAPSALQIGTWKEMTIAVTSTLPDGTVVKSPPASANIDDGLEYAVVTTMSIGGTLLDVTAGIASIFFIFQPTFETGVVFIGALLGGLALNVGQSGAQYLVALSEERRWSDQFADVLRAHARDVRAKIGTGPLPGAPVALPPPIAPSAERDPAETPPLLDPAEPR